MTFDIIFEYPLVVDGSGKRPYRADVGIKDRKVSAIGQLDDAKADRRINAIGKVLCPGFIDVHSHTDLSIHLPEHPQLLEPLIRQGITTFVGGNCGMALAPLNGEHKKPVNDLIEGFTGRDQSEVIDWETVGEFMDTVEKRGVLLNMGMLAPHGIMRINQMGLAKKLASSEEIEGISVLLRDSLEAGALGMSTGLQYFPGSQSDTRELIELAHVVKEYDGVYTSHLRSYSNTLGLALDEIKEITRKAGVPGQVSHLFWVPHVNDVIDPIIRKAAKLGSKIYEYIKLPIPLDLAVADMLGKLGKEVDQGLQLGIDGMPTSAGFTHLLAFFPPWVLQDNIEKILARIANPVQRKKMREDIEKGESTWPHRDDRTWSMNFFKLMGWDGAFVMAVVSEKNKKFEGLNFVQIGKILKKHPFDAACDLLLEEKGRVLVFETVTHPGDDFVERSLFATMKDPNVSIVTDTILLGYGRPSHLFYDCFPKFISRYIRDYKSVSLQEGIRKCTSLPASQLGIKKRGTITEGYWADLVLFDFDTIETHSTFDKPDVFPSGIECVTINGKVVLDQDGYHPEPKAGQVIRRQNQ